MDAFLALLQWPAMATSLAAAWWMGSRQPGQRVLAFCMPYLRRFRIPVRESWDDVG